MLLLALGCGSPNTATTWECVGRTARYFTPISPSLEVYGDTIDFGDVRVGERSATMSIEVRNTGSGPGGVGLFGYVPAVFTATVSESPLPPNGSTEIRVTFEPVEARTSTAALIVETLDARCGSIDPAKEPKLIMLQGRGTD